VPTQLPAISDSGTIPIAAATLTAHRSPLCRGGDPSRASEGLSGEVLNTLAECDEDMSQRLTIHAALPLPGCFTQR
jgi:hypothetical protein